MLLRGTYMYLHNCTHRLISEFSDSPFCKNKSSQTQLDIHFLHINKIIAVYFDYLHILVPIWLSTMKIIAPKKSFFCSHTILTITHLHLLIARGAFCYNITFRNENISESKSLFSKKKNNDLLSAQIKSSQSRICSLELHVVHITTGWHRIIGCLELQVIFRGRATNYRALLRKRALHFLVQNMTSENKPSYGCWPPCSRTP